MLRALGTHLRDQWMGALALFLVLSTGTAYAAGTIGSEDIIDNSVGTVDLRNDDVRSADVRNDTLIAGGLAAADLGPASVGISELDPAAFAAADITQSSPTSPWQIAPDAIQNAEVLDGTLTGADVASSSLTGADVAADSVTGSDILEASLVGLDGHEAHRDLCDTPSDNSYKDCLTLTFEVTRSMNVLVFYGGGGSHGSYGYSDEAWGECKTKVDGGDRLNPVNLVAEESGPVGMATVIDLVSLSSGSHTVTLACREDPSDMHFEDLSIGVLELAVD